MKSDEELQQLAEENAADFCAHMVEIFPDKELLFLEVEQKNLALSLYFFAAQYRSQYGKIEKFQFLKVLRQIAQDYYSKHYWQLSDDMATWGIIRNGIELALVNVMGVSPDILVHWHCWHILLSDYAFRAESGFYECQIIDPV